jgi:hypothetical protein
MKIKTKIVLYGFLSEVFAAGLFILSFVIGNYGPCGPSNLWGTAVLYLSWALHLPSFILVIVSSRFMGINADSLVPELSMFIFQWCVYSLFWYIKFKNAAQPS